MNDFFVNLYLKKSEVLSLLLEHIELTLLAVLIAVFIGVPLGIFITNSTFADKNRRESLYFQ
ncbi:Glycine betaine/L-proline ABC transporter, permease/glycine betaine/L-proline-binding protein [human gut metagenome]|uniref:Glycine betaine/L-proline ABC transporter, permease/glycine betaine/L-proline-binding protein n=1 Tax=human gut metagenome TaxID=408170 RepID=W1WJQ6_9ZZZZ